MTVKIEYSKKAFNQSATNLVVFSNDEFKNKDFKKNCQILNLNILMSY